MLQALLRPRQPGSTPDPAPDPPPPAGPRLAVVVPIFRHSVLLSEAIESVLAQTAGFPIRLVLVNDGCPHRETDQVCRDYALSYPNRITYLRKPNGGLSDARNHGIRHALANWPSVEAVYMLDADNRLRSYALAHAMAALDRYPDAGWIYPNIDMFGLDWNSDYGGDYSLLIHTMINICEAGSLIRRAVFEAGVWFDTTFKSGFEDWDFFLTAAEAGFRGRNIDDFGFLYRKRAESMLAESERDAEAIRGQMRKKHAQLFSPRRLVELEQREAPRYAIFLADRNQVLLTVDPDASDARILPLAQFEELWWRTRTGNSQHHAPPILVVTQSAVLEQLHRARLLHGVLWRLERRLAGHSFAALEIGFEEAERLGSSEQEAMGAVELRAGLVMVQPGLFAKIAGDISVAWAAGLAARPCNVTASLLRLRLPRSLAPKAAAPCTTAAQDFVALCARFQASRFRDAAVLRWDWRVPGIIWRDRSHEIVRVPTEADAAYPRLSREDRRDVGFLLPLAEFGGVERVAMNVARAMKRAGWRPHLFVLEAQDCLFSPEWREVFESVTFLAEPGFATWGPAGAHYLGTDVPDWARSGDQRNAIAMLAWLDVVINFHSGAISGVMGRLKRFGVRTALSLHLSDRSPFQRLNGNTYLGLAFEHAYDLVLPCSGQLSDWCHGMGIPEEKIVPLPNAPGFELPAAAGGGLAATLGVRLGTAIGARTTGTGGATARRARALGAPLRVIYLGRLDPQKGAERLLAIMDASLAMRLPVEWRLIGKAVLDDGSLRLPSSVAARIEPPLTAPADLAAAFSWADVFLLPSYYEGLPLTILEAMRSGVIPMATDSGAVTEVLRPWENGVVLSQEAAVPEALAALARLAADPGLVTHLSEKARVDMQGRDWNSTVQPLLGRLEAMMAKDVRKEISPRPATAT